MLHAHLRIEFQEHSIPCCYAQTLEAGGAEVLGYKSNTHSALCAQTLGLYQLNHGLHVSWYQLKHGLQV